MKKSGYLLPLSILAPAVTLLIYTFFTWVILNPSRQTRPPQNIPSNIPGGLSETIAAREYHISYDRTRHIFQSPNRTQNLRAYYRPGNLTIQNRVDSSGHNFALVLKNKGILADGRLIDRPDPAAKPEMLDNKLLIRHSKFTEEFINNEEGVRQNFIIQQAPAGAKELEVKLTARGLHIQNGAENELLFFTGNNKTHPRLIYRDLKCWDAENRPLTAHLTGKGQQILISVDVRDAVYPVTIDPIVVNGSPGNANALFESDQADAWLGFSVASAGDVNSDGHSDVLAGAPHYDNGEDGEGAVFLYYGSAAGLNPVPTLLESNQPHAGMGYSVSGAGDINSDGFSDIALGAPFYDKGQPNEGVVFVHLGSPNGVKPNPVVILESNQFEAHFGMSVALAGDINADSYSDLIVGANEFDQGQLNEGAAFVYYGSKSGFDPNQVTTLEMNQPISGMGTSVAGAGDVNADGFSDVMVGAPFYDQGETNEGGAFIYMGSVKGISPVPVIIQGNQADAHLGTSLASAGDINGDNYSDVIIGAPHYDKLNSDQGLVKIHLGSTNGIDANTSVTLAGQQMEEEFGRAVACAGDVEGDGYADILITGRTQGKNLPNEGLVMLFSGTHAGINKKPASVFKSSQTNAYLGQSLASTGDVDGDGYADIAIGAYYFDGGLSNEGAVYIHHGNQNGVNAVADKVIEGEQLEAQFGWAVASAGDVNGDGYGDLIVGARYFDNGNANEGAAFVYHGSSVGLNTTATSLIESNQGEAWLGFAVSSAGDVNGDGYSDILIGSYAYDHGQTDEGQVFVYHGSAGTIGATPRGVSSGTVSGALLGSSVSIIGDYNGDGLDDILAGAPNFDGGQVGEGAVFLSFGDAATGTNSMKKLESDQVNAKLGCSVSGAGDHNGDGFDDLVIGATGGIFGGNTGVAYVYNGNAQGNFSGGSPLYQVSGKMFGTSVGSGDINRDGFTDIIVSAPLVTNGLKSETGLIAIFPGSGSGVTNANYTLVYGPSAGTKLGSSLATADVNGDGFMDIIAGAGLSSGGEGSFHIWHGSAAGIPTGTISKIDVKSNTPNASFGASIASAGDVNGDGFGDIIIGSPGITNGQNNEGVARVYYGSLIGISSPFNTLIEVNQAEAAFGTSVAGGGDVNGDGYDDVIVGAPYYDDAVANGGGVWIFHGSYNGLSTTSSFSLKGQTVEDHFGQAVSGGGDLNGDGYSDIVVGIPGMDQSGMTNNGAVRAYFGNDGYAGKNKRNSTRLYNTNLTPMTYSQSTLNSVVVGIHATSFLGRNNGRLAWDYTQNGTSFSKVPNNPITTSTIVDDAQASFGTLSGTEVKTGITKPWTATRLRIRFKYELTTALTGQVYGPWRTVPEYLLYFPAGSPPVLASEEFERAVIQDVQVEYKDLVSVYPNPVSDRLFIQSTNMDQVTSLHLISANGTMAFTSSKPQSEVDVRHLATGSYILVINRKDGTKTSHKVLIRK